MGPDPQSGCGGAADGWAQASDIRAAARTAAIAGRRDEAVTMLEGHLKDAPRDADARLLLGVVLSWDGKYDDADRELRRVLEQSPTYNDARVALANVAWWTGNYAVLQELAATGRVQRPCDVEWILLDDPTSIAGTVVYIKSYVHRGPQGIAEVIVDDQGEFSIPEIVANSRPTEFYMTWKETLPMHPYYDRRRRDTVPERTCAYR